MGRVTRRWARHNGCAALPFEWSDVDGPLFGNTLATLHTSGRDAEAVFEQPRSPDTLDEVARVSLVN